VTAPEERTSPTRWSAVRDVERLIERHRKLLALDYSPAGWKTAQMIEQRLHAIADRLLQSSTPYASLAWLLENRDAAPILDLTQEPELQAVANAFDYLEALEYPDDPRRAICLSAPGP
jgi:aryl-alcohol dehydrogenase-like predicted oxidoreductase